MFLASPPITETVTQNQTDVEWAEIHQREAAECSSSVWTQRPTVIENDSKITPTSDLHCCSNGLVTSCLS